MTTHLIVIAVENYHASVELPKVDYAKKDATDLVEAFRNLGCTPDSTVTLFDEKATQSSILQQVKRISQIALNGDRIIIYFSGHGFFEGGKNYLGPVDASKTAITETCVSIDAILGTFKQSDSRQKILFLDCCHSGFEAGDITRQSDDSFMADELIYQFSKEEFCIGFSSCKNNQKSISHPKLKNGVWSHYLIRALSGDATGIYKNGLLFSDALQSYLKKQTTEFVKLNTTSRREQTPIKFGSETDKFIIADLNSIFSEREMSRVVDDVPLPNISMIVEEIGAVRSLPGFQSGYHHVPTQFGRNQDNFIADIGSALIEKEISNLSSKLRESLKYKRTEINADPIIGSIETIDFDYDISIAQSSEYPGRYVLTRQLRNFKNSSIILTPEFNQVFSKHFNCLKFETLRHIDVEDLIDRIESFEEGSPVKVNYNTVDTTKCTITVSGLDYSIDITSTSVQIKTETRTSPQMLIDAYKATSKSLAQNVPLKLLS